MPNKKMILTVLLGMALLTLLMGSVLLGLRHTRIEKELKEQKTSFSTTVEKLNKENLALKDNYAIIQNNYAALQKEHQELVNSHDVLAKEEHDYVTQKERIKKLAAYLAKVKNDKDSLEQEKDRAVDESFALKEQVRLLGEVKQELLNEKAKLEETLLKVGDKNGAIRLQKEKAALEKENNELLSRLKQVDADLKKISDSKEKSEKEAQELSQRLDTLSREYAEVARKNKAFEQKVANDPKKFAELAHQNKVLIRRTSNMHYNLGVFYTERKQYSRAVAEYEKALELTPDDIYAHFNLGYIYAEYEVNREKATEHFRHYLRLAKEDDKDVDWVRKYLLTWESYDGKKPIE